jgi:hypothetical protein
MTDKPRGRSNRRLLVGAATGAVALGAIAALMLSWRSDRTGAATPTGTALASPSGLASASPSPSSVASASVAPTASASGRSSGALGAANDAVIVRTIGGDVGRPDEVEVSLVTLDAAAYEVGLQPRVIARIPGAVVPSEVELVPGGPKYGQDGWLAIEGGLAAEPFGGRVVIFDLRDPDAEPWVVPGEPGGSAWGPGSVLAIADEGRVHLHDARSRTSRSIEVPAGVVVSSADSPMHFPPTWLADGSGFATWQDGDGAFGRLGLDETHTEAAAPAPIFQSTGRERRWSPGGMELTFACGQDAGPESCAVSAAHGSSAPVVWWTAGSGGGVVQDYVWDATGAGAWLLTERVTGEGPVTYALAHATAPNAWTDVSVMALEQPSDGGFEIQGIADAAPTLDGRHVLIGPQGSTVQVTVSGDGSRISFDEGAWFAGWAADQGPYPASAR